MAISVKQITGKYTLNEMLNTHSIMIRSFSAAKHALIGLSNTLAIEGERNNIHCNCIVPTAASRLTKDILPENLYNELSRFRIYGAIS